MFKKLAKIFLTLTLATAMMLPTTAMSYASDDDYDYDYDDDSYDDDDDEDYDECAIYGHDWSDWETTKEATVKAKGVKSRYCYECYTEQTKEIAKLKPTIGVSLKKLVLPVGCSQKISVTKMAKGDSVKSWKSSNNSILYVPKKKSKSVTVTARSTGKAKITVTLKSGKKKVINVYVCNNAVTFNPSTSYRYGEEGGVVSRLKAVSYSPTGALQATFLFINSRMFFANKFDWIDITITNGSKTIAKQRFTNIPLNLARNGGTGTVTFTFDQGTRVKNSNLQSGEVDFSDDWWYTYTY